jgi:hypothetical protein
VSGEHGLKVHSRSKSGREWMFESGGCHKTGQVSANLCFMRS